MKAQKKIGLNLILKEMSAGKMPAEISKKYNIPKQTLSYSTTKLKELGCLEKLPEYGQWKVLKGEVPIRPKDTSKLKMGLKDIRGHAFIWNIEFLEDGFDWMQVVENYKKRYKKPALSFKMICNGKVPRTIFKNRKIWLTKSGLTIYEPLDFCGESSFSVKGMAVFEMDQLVKALLKKLKLKFQYYRFKCSREHFAHVHNQMARQFNDRKQKIKVEWDGKWFWIDFSDGINEEETDDANVSRQAQKHYISQMKTKFAVTPEFILEGMEKTNKNLDKLTNAQVEGSLQLTKYEEQNKEHLGLIQEYREESRGNAKLIQALLIKLGEKI